MKKTGCCVVSALLLIMICQAQTSWAETAYSIDSRDIPVRATPNSKGKVLATIPPGAAVDVQQSSRWVLVQYTDSAGTRKGWVDALLLGPKPPEGVLVKQLEDENSNLKTGVASLEKERNQLLEREKSLAEKLAKVETSYEELKGGAANYLQLKEEHESTMSALARMKEDFDHLNQENQSLKISQRIKWFGAGGLVLLLGWFIGWVTGRQQKRKRSSYFF